LHDNVSDLFAKFLKADVEFLNSGSFYDISLAAKWCQSLDCSFDKSILLCESTARRVFPVDSHPEIDFIWTNLERASLSPPEGLAGGESEGQGELRLGEAEGNPLGWGRGFGFFGERSGDFGGVGGGAGLARFMIGRELDLNECMQMVATNSRFSSPLQLPPACGRRGIERIVDVAPAWIIAHQGWAKPGLLLLLPNLEIFVFFFF
jgi:hypothetical protein